ncbi:MAG: glycosyltransferase family 39 protein [Planctomycetota bacterium]
MSAFLIPACSALLFFRLRARRAARQEVFCWRTACVQVLLVQGVLIVFSTEALSWFQAITFPAVFSFWVLVDTVLLYRVLLSKHLPLTFPWEFLRRLPRAEQALLVLLAVLLSATLASAVLAPPNNADAIQYHMTRVQYWEQNAGLRFISGYFGYVFRQNEMQPLAEYAILHLQILSGGDRFANLVQWVSYIGCLLAASRIVRHLGASFRGEILTVVFAATLPMAVLQSSGAQNDLVAAFGLVSVVLFGMQFTREPNGNSALLWGASIGLATMAKGTNWIFAFPFGFFFLWRSLSFRKPRVFLHGLAIVLAILTLNAGYFARQGYYNGYLRGNTQARAILFNSEIGVKRTLSNLLKNMALHIVVPPNQADWLGRKLGEAHTRLGIELDTPVGVVPCPFVWPRTPHGLLSEQVAGGPFHFLLVFPFSLYILLKKNQAARRERITLLGCLLVAFVLFGILLNAHIYNARKQIPLFVTFSPLAGLAMQEARGRSAIHWCAGFLLVFSLLPAFENIYRPLIGATNKGFRNLFNMERTELYFYPRFLGREKGYQAVCDFVLAHRFRRIGLLFYNVQYEYPLWAMLRDGGAGRLDIRQIPVDQEPGEREDIDHFFYHDYGDMKEWTPEAILVIGENDRETIRSRGRIYRLAVDTPWAKAFVPEAVLLP